MSELQKLLNRLEHLTCPKCGAIGNKKKNVTGFRICGNHKCRINSFMVKQGKEHKRAVLNRVEIPDCPVCGEEGMYNGYQALYCGNTSCRIHKFKS